MKLVPKRPSIPSVKLVAFENPEKARIWFNFYSRWPNMEKHEFDVPDEKIMKELNSAFE